MDEAGIPEAWRAAAEEVRAHLTALRGGGVFLSPTDAWQLVRWLEQGVSVSAIAIALERAALARRDSRGKMPLSLMSAKRHLGKEARGFFHPAPPARGGEPPLAPVVRAMQLVPATFDAQPRARLEPALLAVVDRGEEGVRQALAAIREFLDGAWDAAGADRQAGWRAEAVEELGDLLALVDEGTGPALIEEAARDRLRARYPALTAATLRELLLP